MKKLKRRVLYDNIKIKTATMALLLIFVLGTVAVAGAIDMPQKTKLTVKTQKQKIYATLKTDDGKPIKSQKLKFTIKGKNYYAKTNSKGQASVKYAKYGTYKFTVKFAGNKQYKTVNKTGTLKNKKPIVKITCRPSCGCCSKAYTWRTRSYVSYCPNCHHYGTVYNKHKWAARHEQELTCGHCDSDFCGNCGKEKMGYSRKYLTKA